MLKRSWKKFQKSDFFAWLVGILIMAYLRLVYFSCRNIYTGRENLQKIWPSEDGIIMCFWHGRLLMTPFILADRPHDRQVYALTSPHRDGRLYTAAITRGLNASPVFGSSSKRSTAALRESVRYLKKRGLVNVTPDGPRGPVQHAAAGAVLMSRLSGAWILPVSYGSERKKILNSWDKLVWPFPMGRQYFHLGEPFKASDFGDDTEKCRRHLESSLNAMNAAADKDAQG